MTSKAFKKMTTEQKSESEILRMPELFLIPGRSLRFFQTHKLIWIVSAEIQENNCTNRQQYAEVAWALQPFLPDQDTCTADKDDIYHRVQSIGDCWSINKILMTECLEQKEKHAVIGES